MLSKIDIVELMQEVGHDRSDPDNAALYARHMSPNLRVVEPESIPYAGVFQGPERLAELDRIHHATWSSSSHKRLRYLSGDDFVAVYLEATFTSRATGRTLVTNISEWWRFEGEQIVEIEIFYKDTAAVLAVIAS
jgi:hypothetical protein